MIDGWNDFEKEEEFDRTTSDRHNGDWLYSRDLSSRTPRFLDDPVRPSIQVTLIPRGTMVKFRDAREKIRKEKETPSRRHPVGEWRLVNEFPAERTRSSWKIVAPIRALGFTFPKLV